MNQSSELGTVKSLATYDYKKWGHRLIDDLVGMGMERSLIYRRLAKKLRVPEIHAHFRMTNDDPRLYRMVGVLQNMVEARTREYINHMRAKQKKLDKKGTPEKRISYKKMFTDKEVLREVGRRNSFNLRPWYKKVFDYFHESS